MEKLTLETLPQAVSQLSIKLENIEKLLLEGRNTTSAAPTDKLMTIEEAAEFLHLSKPTLYSKVSRGELPVMKRSKRLYFSQLELLDYLKKGRKKTNDDIGNEADTYLNDKK